MSSTTISEYCVTVTDHYGCEAEDCVLIIDTTSAIIEMSTINDIKLFPNPASVFINIEGLKRNDVLSIYDVAGELIKVDHLSGNTATLGLNKLPEGIYFLEVRRGDEMQVFKVTNHE